MARLTEYIIKSFRAKICLALISAMLFAWMLGDFLVYRFSLKAQFGHVRQQLKVIAQTAALFIDPAVLAAIPLRKAGMQTAEYAAVAEQINKIRKANPPISSIYVMARTDKTGILQFVVDADIPNAEEIRRKITFYPGDRYDATRFPEMLKAFDAPAADKAIGQDEWGHILSGYAPVRDANGKAVAIVGVDIAANDVYALQNAVHLRALVVLLLGVLLSVGVGFFISRSMTAQLGNLVTATKRIAGGDLRFHVEVQARDEVGALAVSFNTMVESLVASRNKLHDFFYNTMQSFVRILEAKDLYLRGHSQRVAEYAGQIATALEWAPDQVALLKDAALLHDIGKLGIHESILNKKEKLTQEEWEIIRRHPIVGEEILKPVIFRPEMLSVIRGHHERSDGSGYPDALTEKNIPLFAAVIAVADAYDAMVSDRAYRASLTVDEAIEELKRNKNTQFNSMVVDAFVTVMRREKQDIS